VVVSSQLSNPATFHKEAVLRNRLDVREYQLHNKKRDSLAVVDASKFRNPLAAAVQKEGITIKKRFRSGLRRIGIECPGGIG